MDSVRCPACRDLFVPEDRRLPTHYLDPHGDDSAPKCEGSGIPVWLLPVACVCD